MLLGNGDGTFQLTKTYAGDGGVNLIAGDFNGDGILDLLFSGDDAPISLALGNGDGTFQTPVVVATSATGCPAFSPTMLVSDFNGDGNLDFAFCAGDSIGIVLGNGDGTFQKPTYYPVTSERDFSFTAGDFNSDGNTDILISDFIDGRIEIYLGNGNGTFQPRVQVLAPGEGVGAESGAIAGDFNSDGLLDFIFENDGEIGIYLQR